LFSWAGAADFTIESRGVFRGSRLFEPANWKEELTHLTSHDKEILEAVLFVL
jgi:hypothetical protein